MSDFKGLVEEMKAFYGVSSLEAVAEKMGYARNTAVRWRYNKKLSAHALIKWLEAKSGQDNDVENFDMLAKEMKAFYGVSSLEAVAEKMGYSKDNAISWQKNQKLSAHALIKWLEAKQQTENVAHANSAKPLPDDTRKAFPVRFFSGINASAGYGIENSDTEYDIISIDEALLMGARIKNRKNIDIISVSGDSMLPFFHNGESIIVERNCEAANGNTVIANIAGDLYIKRIEKDPLGNFVRLISTNKEYATIVLRGQEMEKLRIVGVVRGVFRPL